MQDSRISNQIESLGFEELQELETPCFVIDENILDLNYGTLFSALDSHWGNSIVGYSIKTNPLPWLLSYAQAKGCFAEAVSDYEYMMALEVGYDPSRIIFNGPIKSKQWFIYALENNSIVNIDSGAELQWLEEYAATKGGIEDSRVGLRVNIDLESMCPGESRTGIDGSRFGFCYQNGSFQKALDRLRSIAGLKISGLHLHVNSKTRTPEVYIAISQLACDIAKEMHLDLEYVDIGGGFFGGYPNLQAYDQYVKAISAALKDFFNPAKTALVVEPGGAMLATAVCFVSKVVDSKLVKDFSVIVTQASRVWLDSTMSKSSFFSHVEYNEEHSSQRRPIIERQLICGYTCMDSDRLFELSNSPQLLPGDFVIFDNVGAYTYSFSPISFIEPPPAFYCRTSEGLKLVQKRLSIKSVIEGCCD